MNKDRRKRLGALEARLTAIVTDLDEIKIDLGDIRDEEQESFDNLAEGLQASENGQNMEQVVEYLTESVDAIANGRSPVHRPIRAEARQGRLRGGRPRARVGLLRLWLGRSAPQEPRPVSPNRDTRSARGVA
jgi:hypothetical protein